MKGNFNIGEQKDLEKYFTLGIFTIVMLITKIEKNIVKYCRKRNRLNNFGEFINCHIRHLECPTFDQFTGPAEVRMSLLP